MSAPSIFEDFPDYRAAARSLSLKRQPQEPAPKALVAGGPAVTLRALGVALWLLAGLVSLPWMLFLIFQR